MHFIVTEDTISVFTSWDEPEKERANRSSDVGLVPLSNDAETSEPHRTARASLLSYETAKFLRSILELTAWEKFEHRPAFATRGSLHFHRNENGSRRKRMRFQRSAHESFISKPDTLLHSLLNGPKLCREFVSVPTCLLGLVQDGFHISPRYRGVAEFEAFHVGKRSERVSDRQRSLHQRPPPRRFKLQLIGDGC